MTRRRSAGVLARLAVEASAVWLRDGLLEPLRSRPSPPRAMHYLATHRCNARCVMCGIWKEDGGRDQELSPEALATVLGDRLFRSMEYVGISGGEPFVRDDLPELCRVVLRACPKVKRLSLTTNGLLTRRMAEAVPEIAADVRAAGALLDVSVSAHGMGATLDGIYGVDDAFGKTERTIALLEELRDAGLLSCSMNCVLLADNLSSVRELRSWAARRRMPISFVVGEHRLRFRTEGLDDAFASGPGEDEMIAFLGEVADDPAEPAVAAAKYREIVDMLEGRRERTLSCYYAMGGLLLGHDGRLYYCSHSREIGSCLERPAAEVYLDGANLDYRRRELLGTECRHCPPYTRTRWEIERDLPRTLAGVVVRRLLRPRGAT
jgi:MoaA/NifB/PqqE/SkfB family radical SAM enzyme